METFFLVGSREKAREVADEKLMIEKVLCGRGKNRHKWYDEQENNSGYFLMFFIYFFEYGPEHTTHYLSNLSVIGD